jgi:type IV pilus assembly protein PilM
MYFLSKLFPPPNYLTLPVYGVDISDNSFKYAFFSRVHDSYILKDFGSSDIPTGILSSGMVANSSKLAERLETVLASKKARFVSISLPEEKGYLQIIELPPMQPEEIEEALSLQIEDYVPLPADEVSFDYQVLPNDTPAKNTRLLLTAFPKSIIQSYMEASTEANLVPVAFEMESQAIARVAIPRQEAAKTTLVIDIGLNRSSFLIAKNNLVYFTSTVPIGGKEMNSAIAASAKVSPEQAIELKIKHGLSQTKGSEAVYTALLPIVNSLKDEVVRHMDFWRTHNPLGSQESKGVEKIYLCGGDANLTGLPRYLSGATSIPVTVADVWANIRENNPSYIPDIVARESLSYATSIGLAWGIYTELSGT